MKIKTTGEIADEFIRLRDSLDDKYLNNPETIKLIVDKKWVELDSLNLKSKNNAQQKQVKQVPCGDVARCNSSSESKTSSDNADTQNLKQPNHNQKKPGSNIMSGELGNDTKNVSISDNRRGSLDSVKEDKPSVGACNHGSGKQ